MRKQDQLNDLIRSLSKNEKRYFKLHASLHSGDKTFKLLFDEMAKNDTYETETLSKKLNVSKPVLAHVKGYLEKVLLSSLRLYEQDRNVDLDLANQIQTIKILFERNKVELAFVIMEKALTKALFYENFVTIIVLLRLKIILLLNLHREDEAKITRQQKHEAFKQLEEEEKLWSFLETFADVIEGRSAEYELMEEIFMEKLFNISSEQLKSNIARILWHIIKGQYLGFVKHDLENAIQHTRSALQLYESHPQLVYTWRSGYLTCMSTLSNFYGEMRSFETAILFAKNLEKESDGHRKDISENTGRIINRHARVYQLYWLCLSGKYKEACEIDSKTEFEKKELSTHFYITAQHYHALALFHTGRFYEALKLCEELQSNSIEVLKPLLLSNRLLMVMIHYSLKNHRLLPYLINSAASWAIRHNLKDAPTTEVLYWFKKLARPATVKESQLLFKDIDNVLEGGGFKDYKDHLGLKKWAADNFMTNSKPAAVS